MRPTDLESCFYLFSIQLQNQNLIHITGTCGPHLYENKTFTSQDLFKLCKDGKVGRLREILDSFKQGDFQWNRKGNAREKILFPLPMLSFMEDNTKYS